MTLGSKATPIGVYCTRTVRRRVVRTTVTQADVQAGMDRARQRVYVKKVRDEGC